MKKIKLLNIVVFIIILGIILLGCTYNKQEAIKIVDTAINNSIQSDFVATIAIDNSILKSAENDSLNITDFDTKITNTIVMFDAENSITYEKCEIDGVSCETWIIKIEENKYNKITQLGEVITAEEIGNNDINIINKLFNTYIGFETDNDNYIIAKDRGKRDIIKYYKENLFIIDETKPYQKVINEEKKEVRYQWENISSMQTDNVCFTITDEKIVLLEYLWEHVEQRHNSLNITGSDIIGIVTERNMLKCELSYKNIAIPTMPQINN